MTRKHFEALAAIIKASEPSGNQHSYPEANAYIDGRNDARDLIANEMADYFQSVNANFDRYRFLAACGVS